MYMYIEIERAIDINSTIPSKLKSGPVWIRVDSPNPQTSSTTNFQELLYLGSTTVAIDSIVRVVTFVFPPPTAHRLATSHI